LGAAQLQALAPEAWAELVLQPISAFALLAFHYPVHRLWRAVEDGEPLPVFAPEPTHMAVWRRGYLVHHRTVQADEAAGLRALAAGLAFGELCEQLAADLGDEAAVQRALTFLQRWIGEEMLRDTLAQPDRASRG
jgi:hypothetical protein